MKTQQHSVIDFWNIGLIDFYFIVACVLLLTVNNCVDPRTTDTSHAYDFQVDGKHYQIVASRPASGKDDNILIEVDSNASHILATDAGCSGEVDSVTDGILSIEDANIIYAIGLAVSQSQGHGGKMIYRRMYKTIDEIQAYAFQTVISGNGQIYNRLIIIDDNPPEKTIIVDTNADGILDRMIRGNYQPEDYQEYYSKVLANGLRDSEVEKKYNMYFVAAEMDY